MLALCQVWFLIHINSLNTNSLIHSQHPMKRNHHHPISQMRKQKHRVVKWQLTCGGARRELSNDAPAAHLLCLSHSGLSSSVPLASTSSAPQTDSSVVTIPMASFKLGQPYGRLTSKLCFSFPHRTHPAHKIWNPHWLGWQLSVHFMLLPAFRSRVV